VTPSEAFAAALVTEEMHGCFTVTPPLQSEGSKDSPPADERRYASAISAAEISLLYDCASRAFRFFFFVQEKWRRRGPLCFP
jgi:hypothetical protein